MILIWWYVVYVVYVDMMYVSKLCKSKNKLMILPWELRWNFESLWGFGKAILYIDLTFTCIVSKTMQNVKPIAPTV